jgi:hypothetical protein
VGGDNEIEKGVAERKLAVVIDPTGYKANTGGITVQLTLLVGMFS